ncbi:hypothetical protein DFH08DRAFT_826937 [Mycena albidolilacea]|uniref:Uncharacterized protein n=1 Tax=Mycena albidolilacea TaxID=1033008 RepID=A0AAD6YZA0_9AGAR|nr:hypothetical protein DFH08DRAFT_826937 [Mycena albidolilacea]
MAKHQLNMFHLPYRSPMQTCIPSSTKSLNAVMMSGAGICESTGTMRQRTQIWVQQATSAPSNVVHIESETMTRVSSGGRRNEDSANAANNPSTTGQYVSQFSNRLKAGTRRRYSSSARKSDSGAPRLALGGVVTTASGRKGFKAGKGQTCKDEVHIRTCSTFSKPQAKELGKDEAFPDVNLEIGLYSAKDTVDEAGDHKQQFENVARVEPPGITHTTNHQHFEGRQ